MIDGDDEPAARSPTRSFHGERSNAYLSWAAVVAVLLVGARGLLDGAVHDALFAATVAAVALVPVLALDSRRAALPWEVTVVAVLPVVGAVLAPGGFARQLTLYAGAAALALALTLELHALTEVSLERWLAVAFVAMLSAALAAGWATATWLGDLVVGTDGVPGNDRLMWLLFAATGSGLVAGLLFDRYYRRFPGEELVSAPVDGVDEDVFARRTDVDDYPTLEDRLPASARRQRLAIRALRVGIVAVLAYGLVAFEVRAAANAAGMLVVTYLPAALRRRYGLPFDSGLVLWITFVAFLHGIGSAALYDLTFWWHNLTHPLSATLVGGLGYVALRTLDACRDDVHLPPPLLPGFVVLFVVALGVYWEFGEFGLDAVAGASGLEMPLSQRGLHDTMTDLVFDTVGGVVVALWGIPYLTDLTDAVIDRLEDGSVLGR
ncbi:hypothetical protein [Salinilacihabitans rarus]|uniref:hypothetical protein n=1 Tax=Salinilacihabitans rarus TaxID=2961596 RepID=UPI0020C858BA|nr:hypothetical protein [Salinilacihabitans rarus]